MRPLSIGILCYPSLGGSGVMASELAVGLARRGHRVALLASAPPSRPLPPCPRLTFHGIDTPGYPLFEHAPYAIAAAAKLTDVVRAEKLELIDVHYAVPHAASAQLARAALGKEAPRIVTSLHGTDVTGVGSDPAYRSITSFSVAASDGITVPSSWLREQARERLGLPPSVPIEVLPNFVDTDRFAPPLVRDRSRLLSLFQPEEGDGPVLFHVSNFRPVKRPGDLLEVLLILRRSVPTARLVLVGDGPERASLEARAGALGLSAVVRFLGRRETFEEELRHADAFLLTSESESFGVAALEALASGVPVLAYRVGGLPEVIAPGTGSLVMPFQPAALAAAAAALLVDPAAQRAASVAARAHALASFRRDPALDRHEAFLSRILEKQESSR